jgi:hypothetical protein
MLSMIPLPYKLLAAVALVIGIFVYGYMKGSAYADAELARFAAKHATQVAELEKKNSAISDKVVTEYVDRVNVIKEKEYVYRDLAQTAVPNQHIMSNGWVFAHDASATNGDADTARSSDASPSGIADNSSLITIIGNYSRCQQNAEQLIGLQNWIAENKTAIDELNTKAKKSK